MADFNLSARLAIQDNSGLPSQEATLTDIILPKNINYAISSNPIKKKHNRLFSGDNIFAMEKLLEEGYGNKFDLIYIDPPYLSQSKYSHSIHVPMNKKSKIIKHTTYSDSWKNIDEYMAMLYPRLILMKKLLSESGSIFVHLDWHVSHYVKILLDEVFGIENFRNEILWCYYGPSSPSTRQFNREHQSIFWYSKSATKWNFFPDSVRVPYSKTTLQKVNSNKNGFTGSKHDFSRGKIPENWWSDIPLTQRYRHEVANFETQKPKKLLDRIIKATTKEGDLIGDFFVGSGTTAVVAEENNRRWIASDNSSVSLKITKSRLSPVLQKPFLIERFESNKNEVSYKIKASLSKKRIDARTVNVKVNKFSVLSTKHINNSSTIKSISRLNSLIDSWAIDWNYNGSVFRAVWDDFRGSGKTPAHVETNKNYTFKKEIPNKIAVKLVDVFGNEILKTLRS